MPDAQTALRDYYESYWSPQGFHPAGRTRPELVAVLDRHIPPRRRCLDVGCGDGGTLGAWARHRGCEYVGVDISSNAVRAARERGLEAHVIEDATALPFGNGEFEAAMCFDVFEHLFQPQLAAAEIARVLRQDGVLVVATPNAAYWRRRVELGLFGRFNPYGDERAMVEPWRDPHLRFFTAWSLRRMLEAAGLRLSELSGFNGALLRDLPRLRALGRGRSSPAYRALERTAPSLLALSLVAVARKTAST